MLQSLKTREDLHLARKLFHMLAIIIILMCMIFLPVWMCWAIYALVGVPTILFDYLRRYSPKLNRLFLKTMGGVIRNYEVRRLSGSSYAAVSIGLCFLIFPKPVSLLAVLFLAVGDPVASFFGLLYGKKRIFANKSLVGTFAAFVACTLASFIFFSLYKGPIGVEGWTGKLGLSAACGLIGAISELLSFFKMDDNLTQPLLSGFLLNLLFWQLGGVIYV